MYSLQRLWKEYLTCYEVLRARVLSCVQLFATPWIVACQAPLFVGFSGQEYWSGLLFPSPEYLPDAEIESRSPVSPAVQIDSLLLSHRGSPPAA